MSKMPEKLCLCSLLARPASPPRQEWMSGIAWCRQVIPGATFSPRCPPSWANHLETTKSLCQEPGVSHPHHPTPAPSVAKQTAALGPLPSPLPPFGEGCCEGRQRQRTRGTRGGGDMAPGLPSTPALCPPRLLGRRASAGGGRCGEGPGVWGHPQPRRGWRGMRGTHLAEDVGTCPLSVHHPKRCPEMPESPWHVATPVCSH